MAASGDIKRPEALQTPSAPLCYRGAYLRWPSGLPPGKPTFICIVCPIMSGLSSKLVIIASIICRTLHLNEASYMLLCLNESKASNNRLRCFHPFCSGRNFSIHHHQYAPLGTGATCCVMVLFQKRVNR